jgi:adenylosuccinate synthase
MKWIGRFRHRGRAAVVLGGQFGSEGKGAAVAWLATQCDRFDVVTTNAAAQAGHTSIHNGVKHVVNHLPTAPLIQTGSHVYLNAGCVIDPELLFDELARTNYFPRCDSFTIDPMATIITPECKDEEQAADSQQTLIASTRKGVGVALARKTLRSGMTARDHPELSPFIKRLNLNTMMGRDSMSVLVEVPQGLDLSLNSMFYPHVTSRNCTVAQGLADAGIHPCFIGPVMLVLRCHPIRVGNIVENGKTLGNSGGVWSDQRELTWDEIGRPPEITTVTGRVRRVFSWSAQQTDNAISACRPDVVFLTHCDYIDLIGVGQRVRDIVRSYKRHQLPLPLLVLSRGPSTADVHIVEKITDVA